MPTIIGINPIPKREKTKRGNAMAAKKSSSAPKTRTIEKIRWKTRKPAKKTMAKKQVKRGTATADIGRVIRDGAAAAVGMVMAKIAVNKLTEGGSETDLWSWPNIFMAAASSMIGGFAVGTLLGLKKITIAMIGLGGVALAFYKMITTKFAQKWEWSKSWLGADEDDTLIAPEFQGSILETTNYSPSVGQLPGYMGETDSGGRMVPFDPRFGATDSGGRMVPSDPRFGQDSSDPMSARATAARITAAYSY
jgi:hypothetical protein